MSKEAEELSGSQNMVPEGPLPELEVVPVGEIKRIPNFDKTYFCNIAFVSTSSEEVILEFGNRLDAEGNVSVDLRVALNIFHYKRFVDALSRTLKTLEESIGQIEGDVMKRLTAKARKQIEEKQSKKE